MISIDTTVNLVDVRSTKVVRIFEVFQSVLFLLVSRKNDVIDRFLQLFGIILAFRPAFVL